MVRSPFAQLLVSHIDTHRNESHILIITFVLENISSLYKQFKNYSGIMNSLKGFFFFFNLARSHGIFVLQLGMERYAAPLEAWSFNHWTAKEVYIIVCICQSQAPNLSLPQELLFSQQSMFPFIDSHILFTHLFMCLFIYLLYTDVCLHYLIMNR